MKKLTFSKFTDKTITTAAELRSELVRIKKVGYAFDDEERELGVSCIAAPIFDFDQEIIAAMSISGPTMRFSEESRTIFIQHVVSITQEVSKGLGFNDQ